VIAFQLARAKVKNRNTLTFCGDSTFKFRTKMYSSYPQSLDPDEFHTQKKREANTYISYFYLLDTMFVRLIFDLPSSLNDTPPGVKAEVFLS